MSAILAIMDAGPRRDGGETARRMLARMPERGEARTGTWSDQGVTLAVSRFDWECRSGFAGPVFVVQDANVVVAADATLYYRDDLRRRLADRGVRVVGQTSSHLIAAAYRAWGDRCAEHLEGDFAFVLWDRQARQIVVGRDFAGKRPLYYAGTAGQGMAFASSIDALLAHPGCPRAFDEAVIAETMAPFVRPGGATCYKGVFQLEAGRTAVRSAFRELRIFSNWEVPVFERPSGVNTEEAARELRDLLSRAVDERVQTHGPTAVWMSGGRDSPSVFATGASCGTLGATAPELFPVSLSFPPGDSGREDEYIASIADYLQTRVRWVDSREISLLDAAEDRARDRPQPFAHIFESPLRALSRAARGSNALVALDGVGGDQLFSVSCVYFSDLLRTGRWRALAHEWKTSGFTGSGLKAFLRWAVQPSVHARLLVAAARVRSGRRLRSLLRPRLPEWIANDFVRRHALDRFTSHLPRKRRGESTGSSESRWYLTDPFFTTVHSTLAGIALDEGIEVRSPLLDKRLVAFAATRPRFERCGAGRTKVLLRRAMAGLLPPDVLADRAEHTGTTGSYVDRALRGTERHHFSDVLRRTTLADFGIVDQPALDAACASYQRSGDEGIGLRLLLTLQTELWLRSHIDERARPHLRPRPNAAAFVATSA